MEELSFKWQKIVELYPIGFKEDISEIALARIYSTGSFNLGLMTATTEKVRCAEMGLSCRKKNSWNNLFTVNTNSMWN